MTYELQYSQFNERSILIEWPTIIDDLMLKNILNFKKIIQDNYIKQKTEVITTYNSILIVYEFTIDNINNEFLKLKALFLQQNKSEYNESSIWEIPVCYDDEFGIDLERFSSVKNLSKPEIIKLHFKPVYTVFFIGFLPGFLYLGGLDSKLFLDRKTTPSLNVRKGAVAIGGQQTGIYPQDSPGGWHIIGNSPIELFCANQNPPCFIKAGDKVKFVSIEKSEYGDILNAVNNSKYQLKSTAINA
ncbi:5-oxoprolinase subunit PxpB [Winogradskyella sp.]|uniref:5-oxoprolinase subunit PxpB n=1 Tax=Winogradskyella sp. TaxID=1883156 RepID=UPI0025CE46DE|nr:5-oxoprolinase subunit PxpB [Winogradskyella sp.]